MAIYLQVRRESLVRTESGRIVLMNVIALLTIRPKKHQQQRSRYYLR